MQDSKKKIKLTDVIRFVLLLSVAFFLLVLAFRGISLRAIANQVLKAKFFWVFLSFLVSALAHVSRAIRWRLLIEPLGYYPSLKKTFYAVMTGYLANLAFPRLGEVTRCGSLTKAESIPFNKLLGTVITERLIDVLSLLVCLFIAMIIEFNRLGNFLRSNIIKPMINKLQAIGSSPFVIIAMIVLLVTLFLVLRSLNKRKGTKFSNLVKGITEGVASIRTLKKPWLFIFHSVFIWVLYFLSVYVALFAFSSTENLGLGAALFLLVAGGVAMSAPVQGGIGAYHLLVSQGLLLYGLTQQEGLAFATLLHSLQIILSVVLGSVSFLLLFSARKAKAGEHYDKKEL